MRTLAAGFKSILLFSAFCAVAPVRAQVLEARIGAVRTGAGSLEQVQLSLDWPRDATSGTLRLRAAKAALPLLSWSGRELDWQCALRSTRGGRWHCDGPIRSRGNGAQRLALDFSADSFDARFAAGPSRIAFGRAADSGASNRVRVHKLPVAWLKEFLASMWADGRWNAGDMTGTIDIEAPDKGPLRVRTDLMIDGLGLETPDGSLAASGLDGRMRVDYRSHGPRESIQVDFEAAGGELLFDRFYASLPSTKVQAQVLAQRDGSGPWRLPRLSWRDPGALEVDGQGVVNSEGEPVELDLRLGLANLALARDRYLSGFLAPAGFSDLLLTGSGSGTLRIRGGKADSFGARLQDVNAVDPKARFTLAGLEGSLDWHAGAEAKASELRWRSGALFGIGLGPARFAFGSSGGELRLAQPTPIAALAGQLSLDQLRWQPPQGERGARFQFGLSVNELDLASLSQRLGWPPFTGTISGRIPSARFQDDVLDIDGGLQMSLFGGSVALSGLSMERPFGSAPTVSGEVAIEDVDLEQITKVTGFGTITGRLDGRIKDVRLVSWAPVAFDARLETDRDWKGKRRISQRAVNDISSFGGGGIAGGLQAQALKIFDEFGYERIGLGCRLKESVCTMDGVGSAGDGYIIVAGAGLPRIQVVGFRRQVDWPTLVARLEAATSGSTAPVIE